MKPYGVLAEGEDDDHAAHYDFEVFTKAKGLGVRIRGTPDPLNKLLFKRATSRVQNLNPKP